MAELELKPLKPENPWGGYDFERSSLAVVAADDAGQGAVLWTAGAHVRMEMEEAGLTALDDLGLVPPFAGIWIWEGKYVWHDGPYEYPLDGEVLSEGDWRIPTDEEWNAIRKNECPWDDDDWKSKVD